MSHLTSDSLSSIVKTFFQANARRYGLNPGLLDVRSILNWGGFVNTSFFVSDGAARFHLKLTGPDLQPNLRRWMAVHELLSQRYHAPEIVDWIDLANTGLQGILSLAVPGRAADWPQQPDVLVQVLDGLAQLHADHELAERLAEFTGEKAGERSCADAFCEVYVRRFVEDLDGIESVLPPFVSRLKFDWMRAEANVLEAQARSLAAFRPPAQSPTHGDLGPNNVLVTDAGAWTIIDWDDLSLSDPVQDFALVLNSLWRSGKMPVVETEQYLAQIDGQDHAALLDRYRFYARALVLDEVIDSLADWVEAEASPQHQDEVRIKKERIHHQAYREYQRRWGRDHD
jgi:hypothetical protein